MPRFIETSITVPLPDVFGDAVATQVKFVKILEAIKNDLADLMAEVSGPEIVVLLPTAAPTKNPGGRPAGSKNKSKGQNVMTLPDGPDRAA